MDDERSNLQVFKIRIRGKLKEQWADWFNGMSITYEVDRNDAPITTLTGPVIDQAALHGILAKIRDLNLRLISVVSIEDHKESEADD